MGALADPDRRAALAVAVGQARGAVQPPGSDDGWARPFAPGAIAGVGLNFTGHAADIGAPTPPAPGFFAKIVRTAVSTGATILLPPESQRTTADGELALVVGRRCFRASPEADLDHLAGVCAVLDQTAEDQLQENVRFLTRCKNYPGFFVLGRDLVTLDEVTAERRVEDLEVATVHNGSVRRAAPVSDMAFPPGEILSFVSHVLPLEPGDIVSTGTPGAAMLTDGDTVEARVAGVGSARAAVRRPDPADYRGLASRTSTKPAPSSTLERGRRPQKRGEHAMDPRATRGWGEAGLHDLPDALHTTPAMRRIFDGPGRVRSMFGFEAALARAEARAGLVPADVAERITAAAESPVADLDVTELSTQSRMAGVITLPVIAALRERLDEHARRYVHLGATSQDLVDTAMVLQAREAVGVLVDDLLGVGDACAGLAQRHTATPMVGRTLMQQAIP